MADVIDGDAAAAATADAADGADGADGAAAAFAHSKLSSAAATATGVRMGSHFSVAATLQLCLRPQPAVFHPGPA